MRGTHKNIKNFPKPSLAKSLEAFISAVTFPCLMAKAALNSSQLKSITVPHMGCPTHDAEILKFLYQFVDQYKNLNNGYSSAAVIFEKPVTLTETLFEQLMWERLQALSNLDALQYSYDKRVSADPVNGNFSFSIKEEAFYIIGMHPASSRMARRFYFPVLIFNPHAQFESLRVNQKYEKVKQVIRKRDIALSGSVNPMLSDFGQAPEALQYSGKQHDQQWKCPLHSKHQTNDNHSTS
jgi:FPC/CPF motif-containing protein YcgG